LETKENQEILEENQLEENKTEAQEEIKETNEAQQSPEANEKKVEEMQKEIEEINQRMLRISADFDNFRKRTRLEKEELAKYANAGLITELLPVIDNFQRALDVKEPSSEIKNFLTGFEMIFKQLNEVLKRAGLENIDCVGKIFDPQQHDGVMQVEDDSVEENTILEELRTGYIFKDKVIRPSMVKVAKKTKQEVKIDE